MSAWIAVTRVLETINRGKPFLAGMLIGFEQGDLAGFIVVFGNGGGCSTGN